MGHLKMCERDGVVKISSIWRTASARARKNGGFLSFGGGEALGKEMFVPIYLKRRGGG